MLLSAITRAARFDAPAGASNSNTQFLGSIPEMPGRRNAIAKALATDLDPRGPCAVAFRALCDALLNAGACKTILVTSPAAGAGKSTVAANLAIALAEKGGRVLLVDASFRA